MSTRSFIVVAAVILTIASASAQQPVSTGQTHRASAQQPVAKTPWGHPDLQGAWDYRTITPLERPAQFGDREVLTDAEVKEMEARAAKRFDEAPPEGAPASTVHPLYWTDPGRTVTESRRTSLIIEPKNGRVPALTPEATARLAAGRQGGGGRGAGAGGGRGGGRPGGRADSWLDRSLLERCITNGMPNAILPTLYNNNIQIVQAPDHVAIIHEMVHDTRIIPLTDGAFTSESRRQWLGESRGHWDGDTLVVETKNFSTKTSYRNSTTNLRLVERFRRVGPDKLDFRLTIEDPATWTQPWTVAMTMIPSEGGLLVEYACHEGNYGLRNILEVARDEERAAAQQGK